MAKKLDTTLLEATLHEAKREVDKVTRLPLPEGRNGPTLSPTVRPTLSPTHQPTDQHSDRQTDRHSDRLSNRQTDRHSTQQANQHSDQQSAFNKLPWISPQQVRVLQFLIAQNPYITRLEDITKSTGVPYGTVRDSLRRLTAEKCISKPVKYRRGNHQGIKYNINESVCDGLNFNQHTGQHSYQHSNQPTDRPTHWPTVPILEEEDNRYLLLDAYLALVGIGFEKKHFQDISRAWKQSGLNLEHLAESLERADYAVENKSFPMDDPLAYIYSSLLKGTFRKPPEFKSRAELQAENILSEQKRIAEMRDEAFQLWCDNLPQDKRAEYCEGVPRVKHRSRLREIFDSEAKTPHQKRRDSDKNL